MCGDFPCEHHLNPTWGCGMGSSSLLSCSGRVQWGQKHLWWCFPCRTSLYSLPEQSPFWSKWYPCVLGGAVALTEQKPWSSAEPVFCKLSCLWGTWIQSFSVVEMFVKAYSWSLTSEQVACTLLRNRATARAVSEQTKVWWEEDLLQLCGLEGGGQAASSVTSPVSRAFSGEAWARAATAPVWVPQEPLQGVATGEYKGAFFPLHCKAVQSSTCDLPFANGHVKY